MGLMTKQYLRYIPGSMFGIVGFGNCIHFIAKAGQTGKYIAVPACEEVLIWDLRRKVKVLTLKCEDMTGTVTVIEPRPPLKGSLDNTHIAVGYSEGTLVLYDCNVGQSIQFNGHRGGISALAWDPEGMRVASGSVDGEIVIWDMVSERGVVRLRGHKGRINRIRFLETRNVIISCAKDWYIKFWDLDTNHCFCTLAKNYTEAWDFAFLRDDTRLVVGGGGSEMNVFSVEYINQFKDESNDSTSKNEEHDTGEPLSKMMVIDSELDTEMQMDDQDNLDDNPYVRVKRMGSIMRSKTDRVSGLVTDGRVIATYGKSSVVDLFVVATDEEIEKKTEKRIKKSRKRAREANLEYVEDGNESMLADEMIKLPPLKTSNKVKAISLFTSADDTIQISTLHGDNSLTVYESSVNASRKKADDECDSCIPVKSLSSAGHRMEVRNVLFNTLGDQIITTSADAIKVWHRHDCQVVRTIECNYPLSLILPPGDRHVLVGTRTGHLQLYDLATGNLLEDFEAHEKNEKDDETGVWALALTHDGRGFVSGGSDCMVKFWNFELVEDSNTGRGKRLSFLQDSRALKVADQLTCLRCCNSGKYLAVATFDLKETVYYTDSLKLVHEFYGKSMPSTCLDFSSDNNLIVTGSKDACIRIFATNFGDQKRFIKNCHQGGVTEVRFVPNTHLFFSCGHDSTVKQWDADNFQRIITLKGHFGIVRGLAVSHNGSHVVSCGQDRSLRLWEKTNEPLVLGDEREEERMKESEEGAFQRPVLAEEKDALAVRASKMSRETEKAADQLLEALAIYRQQKEAGDEAVPNQLMTLVYKTEDPLKFVLLVLRKIKSSELEEAIIVLPLNMILVLLVCLKGILEREWDVELATRVLVVAVRINLPQLLRSKEAFAIIRALAKILPKKTEAFQHMVGFNLAGLRHMQHRMEERSENKLFVEAATKEKDKRKRGKRKERILKRALLTI